MIEFERFDKEISRLAAAFGRRLTDEAKDEWYDLFIVENEDLLYRAFDKIKRSATKFPVPKDIFDAISAQPQKSENSSTSIYCECSNCINGVIITTQKQNDRLYDYVYRCPKSSRSENWPIFRGF